MKTPETVADGRSEVDLRASWWQMRPEWVDWVLILGIITVALWWDTLFI